LWSARFWNELRADGTAGTAANALIDGLQTQNAGEVNAAAQQLAMNASDVAGNNLRTDGGNYADIIAAAQATAVTPAAGQTAGGGAGSQTSGTPQEPTSGSNQGTQGEGGGAGGQASTDAGGSPATGQTSGATGLQTSGTSQDPVTGSNHGARGGGEAQPSVGANVHDDEHGWAGNPQEQSQGWTERLPDKAANTQHHQSFVDLTAVTDPSDTGAAHDHMHALHMHFAHSWGS